MSERKRQLIYDCASEAVMQARIKVRKAICHMPKLWAEVDDILGDAQHNAGQYALNAVDADARKVRNVQELTR